jgi:hypothetical protein
LSGTACHHQQCHAKRQCAIERFVALFHDINLSVRLMEFYACCVDVNSSHLMFDGRFFSFVPRKIPVLTAVFFLHATASVAKPCDNALIRQGKKRLFAQYMVLELSKV